MWIRIIIVLIILISVTNISSAQQLEPSENNRHPLTPSKSELSGWCSEDINSLKRVVITQTEDTTKYFLNDKLFSGWACSSDISDVHSYRFAKFTNGIQVRQIGYYTNGQLDHDFYTNEFTGSRSERMWNQDGTPYIEHCYSSKNNMHGMQYTWYKNNKLARKALFDHGKMIYDIYYDISGNITRQSGKVPE